MAPSEKYRSSSGMESPTFLSESCCDFNVVNIRWRSASSFSAWNLKSNSSYPIRTRARRVSSLDTAKYSSRRRSARRKSVPKGSVETTRHTYSLVSFQRYSLSPGKALCANTVFVIASVRNNRLTFNAIRQKNFGKPRLGRGLASLIWLTWARIRALKKGGGLTLRTRFKRVAAERIGSNSAARFGKRAKHSSRELCPLAICSTQVSRIASDSYSLLIGYLFCQSLGEGFQASHL